MGVQYKEGEPHTTIPLTPEGLPAGVASDAGFNPEKATLLPMAGTSTPRSTDMVDAMIPGSVASAPVRGDVFQADSGVTTPDVTQTQANAVIEAGAGAPPASSVEAPTIWTPRKQVPPPLEGPKPEQPPKGISRRAILVAGVGGLVVIGGVGALAWLREKSQTQQRVQATATVNTRPTFQPSPTNVNRLFPVEIETQTLQYAEAFLSMNAEFLKQVEQTMYDYIQVGSSGERPLVKAPAGGPPNHMVGYDGNVYLLPNVGSAGFAQKINFYRVPLVQIGELQRGKGALQLFGGFDHPGQKFSEGEGPYLLGLYSEGYGGILKPTNRTIDPLSYSDTGSGNPQNYPDLPSLFEAFGANNGRGVQVAFGDDLQNGYGTQQGMQADNIFAGNLGVFFMANFKGDQRVADPSAIIRSVKAIPGPNADMSPYYGNNGQGYAGQPILQ